MADESTAVGTESGSTTTETAPAQESGNPNASAFAKLQGQSAESAMTGKVADTEGEPGKAPASPDKGKEADKAPAKPADKKEEAKAPAFDPLDAEWLKSKVGDYSKLDPSNEAIKTLIKNARNAESEGSKMAQSLKAKEIAEAAKTVKDPAKDKPAERKTKVQEFEHFHETIGEASARMFGYSSLAELEAAYPEIAQRNRIEYLEGRQRAWELDREAKEVEGQKAGEEAQNKQRFLSEIEQSKVEMTNNILKLKTADPEVEKNFESTGVNAFLAKLEQDASWPKSFVLSNPKTAEWLAKAAKAISTLENMDKLKDGWKQEYEKSLKEQEKAKLVSSNNTGGNEKARVASNLQKNNNKF